MCGPEGTVPGRCTGPVMRQWADVDVVGDEVVCEVLAAEFVGDGRRC